MSAIEIADGWARYFGLASVPLFDGVEEQDAFHHVLLDGGFGSFALSATDLAEWDSTPGAEWAWSSDLAHHVAVTENDVTVTRWDKPSPERFTLKSVQGKLDAFYGYLSSDKVRATRGVVEHLISIFRRTRSLVHEAGLDDLHSVNAYLSVLSAAMERVGHGAPAPANSPEAAKALSGKAFDHLVEDALAGEKAGFPLRLHPHLAVRHAGSEIFQEAHFTLSTAASVDMFDYVGAATATKVTRGSSHFTPPALARSICEQTLQQLGNLTDRANLVVLDPACGSGSFLYEAQRALRRTGFKGKLTLIGRDLSPAALSMARYTLEFGAGDWSPEGGVEILLDVSDSLTGDLPAADLVLMNPPFLSWNAMGREQRSLVEQVLGLGVARGDLSMAFVTRALGALNEGGALGTVLPASVMTLAGAEKWRSSLLEQAKLRFVGSLGEYGLFTHAMVNVATLVLQKHTNAPEQEDEAKVLAVISGNRAEATGDALRAVRRFDSLEVDGSAGWQVFQLPATEFADRPTWRLISPTVSAALQRLADSGLTRPIGELFAIRQGVRTGNNSVFVINQQRLKALPPKERKWFRPAAMGDNLNNGILRESEFVFYPYGADGLRIENEDDLQSELPTYYRNHLLQSKAKLTQRANITRSNRDDWWGLSERRAWGSSSDPRIVSKYFGAVGSFALDADASFVVVQGFAWFPLWEDEKPDLDEGDAPDAIGQISTTDLLAAYVAVFNSAPFHRIVSLLSSHVAGGQFDLSPRFMNEVPVPDLAAASTDETLGSRVARLISLGQQPRPDERDWASMVSRIVVELYGSELFEQVGHGSD